MIKTTNNYGFPLPLCTWLLDDDYDYNPDPHTFSASQLIKSTKKSILSSAVAVSDTIIVELDVSSRFSAVRGQNIHHAIHASYNNPNFVSAVAAKLGMPEPKVEMEDRLAAQLEVDGIMYTVTGRFDAAIDNIVTDWKNESVYAFGDEGKALERKYQLSIYAWLAHKNGRPYNTQVGDFYSIYQDWRVKLAVSDKYPSAPILPTRVELIPFPQLEVWMKDAIRERRDLSVEDVDSTLCSNKDLWMPEPVYQYFGSADAKRASKNFDKEVDAMAHLASKGKGIVKPKHSYAKACEYCLGSHICSQYSSLVSQGLIENESTAVSLSPSFGEDS